MLLISRRRKLPLRVNDNYTHHKSWQFFFVEKHNASNLQYIILIPFTFGLFIQKNQGKKKQFSRFGKQKIMIECSVKCQSLANLKTQKLQLNSMLMIGKVKENFLKGT